MPFLPFLSCPCWFVHTALSVHVSVATLRLLVALQVRPALEAVLTAWAAEWTVAAVLSAVGDEVGALAESFSAHLAHMWFLTWWIRQDMSSGYLHLAMIFLLVRSLTCVYEGVFLHVWLLVKPFATVQAGVGPRVRVDEEVSRQGGRALEHLSTHLASEATLLDKTLNQSELDQNKTKQGLFTWRTFDLL